MLGGCDAGCSEVASSSSRRLVEVREKGLLMELGLLKMILTDGNLLEVPMLKGKEVMVGEVRTSFVEGRNCGLGEDVETIEETRFFNRLAAFSKFLGMPTQGFEDEILALLDKIKARKNQGDRKHSKRKNKSSSSRSKRELKKLKWSVNYKRSDIEGGKGRECWVLSTVVS